MTEQGSRIGASEEEPKWLKKLLKKYGEKPPRFESIGSASQRKGGKRAGLWKEHPEISDELKIKYPNPGEYYKYHLRVAKEKGKLSGDDAIEFALKFSHDNPHNMRSRNSIFG